MIAQVSMKAQTLERLTGKQLELDKPTISVPSKKDAEAAQKLVTKKAYRTWANDLGILRFGGKQYIIPEETPFLKVTQNCPYREGFAEITFSEAVFRSFYPYDLLPSRLAVVVPHECLHITPKKGLTWKEDRI